MAEKIALLLLIIVANGVPILLDDILGRRWDWPLDAGVRFAGGRRLLGRSTTLRGLAGAVVATAGAALLLGFSAQTGALIGLFAMIGDTLSSFIKRRLGIAESERAIGLDQIPESLLPLLVVMDDQNLAWRDVGLIVLAFTLFSLTFSRVLFRMKLRKRPY